MQHAVVGIDIAKEGRATQKCTSGEFKGQIKLSKRGRQAANVLVSGRHEHNGFLFKLIGMLARILIGLIRRGESYRSEFRAAAWRSSPSTEPNRETSF